MSNEELQEISNLFLTLRTPNTPKGYIINQLKDKLVEFQEDLESEDTLKLLAVIVDTLGTCIPNQKITNVFDNVSRIILEYCQKDHLTLDQARSVVRLNPEPDTTTFVAGMIKSLTELSSLAGFPYLQSRENLLSAVHDSPRKLSDDIKTFITDTLFKNL